MTNPSHCTAVKDRCDRPSWHALLAGFAALAFALNVAAQAPAAAGGGAPAPSEQELEKLVGPIALYPDDLVAIILPASTFPVEIVQADRFLDKRKADPKLPINENWDDSVKALVNYPDVVKKMSADLDWTTDLGEAVVADQKAVMEAIQVFRRKTQSVGNLKSDDKQKVVVEKEIITIVPANPEVIYVPQYNPTTVVVSGGYSGWGYWPSPYPVYYYPYAPGAAFATGLIWGAAIGAAWGGARWGANWGGNEININRNTNINTGDINRGNGNRGQGAGSGSSAWKSNKQPGQVSSGARASNTSRVGDSRGGGGSGGGFGGAGGAGGGGGGFGGAGGAGAGRPSTQPSGGFGGGNSGAASRAGSASASPRDSYGGGNANRGGGSSSAFGGYGSGSNARADSSRGASSRSSMSGGGGARPSGGGGRGGGGGGGRGGGGRGR
jgi:Protein of unknown function (DUF3300)